MLDGVVTGAALLQRSRVHGILLHSSVGILVDALDELLLDGLRVLMKHLIVGQQVLLAILFSDRWLSDNLAGLEVDRVVLGGVHQIHMVN